MFSYLKSHSKPFLLIVLASAAASASMASGLSPFNGFIVFIFLTSILGSLFFWEYRLGFMFIGSAIYLLVGAVSPEEFVRYASLDVILFLISMMIVVGMMKDAGLFDWLVTLILRIKNLTGRKLFVLLMFISAVFSSVMGEVASIMIMAVTIMEICDLLEVDPVPMIVCSVLATNLGSAATVLGNPVGILIASHSGLSFEDFLSNALPHATINLVIIIAFLLVYYRGYIRLITPRLKEYTGDKTFIRLISIPSDRKTMISICIFCTTIVLIALHKRFELFLNLTENTLLLMFPILAAGVVMIYRHERSRLYIEKEIEWPSIIFFMFLFAQAGVIHATGTAGTLAKNLFAFAGDTQTLGALILFSSGLFSSVLDNVVAVATYIPLIKEFQTFGVPDNNLWWALLFGACFGGNITMIGSTANIVALGLLEKQLNIKVTFIEWFRIGFVVGVITLFTTWGLLYFHLGSAP